MAGKPRRRGVVNRPVLSLATAAGLASLRCLQLYQAHVPFETGEIRHAHRDNGADAVGEHGGDHVRVMDLLTVAVAIAVRHPDAGLIRLEMFQLRLVDQPGMIMVVQVPVSETYLARVRSLLYRWHPS